jgi:glycosyltransferase involved in cell wall biosynthesis
VDSLKILVMAYNVGNGGAISSILPLLSAYARTYENDTLHVVTSEDSWLRGLAVFPNVNFDLFPSDFRKWVMRLVLGFAGIRVIAKRIRADLIWGLNAGTYLPSNVPQVLDIHNSYSVYPLEVYRYHPKGFLRVVSLRWLFRRSLIQSQGVIAQTDLISDFTRRLMSRDSKIIVAPKAVEGDEIKYATLSKAVEDRIKGDSDPSVFSFLYVATFVPHKNHEILVDAMSRLRELGIKSRLIVTVNPGDLRKVRPKLADNLICSGRIVSLGWVEKEQLHALYDACDACVMPSLLESLSSAHLEAMQWGKPQVSSDLLYARDLCRDASLYAAARDSSDWADKMRLIIEDSRVRERLVEAGYKRMADFPKSWSEVANRIRGFFVSVVNGQREIHS